MIGCAASALLSQFRISEVDHSHEQGDFQCSSAGVPRQVRPMLVQSAGSGAIGREVPSGHTRQLRRGTSRSNSKHHNIRHFILIDFSRTPSLTISTVLAIYFVPDPELDSFESCPNPMHDPTLHCRCPTWRVGHHITNFEYAPEIIL